jgi:hypothetical protein
MPEGLVEAGGQIAQPEIEEAIAAAQAEEQEGPQEIPSVFSVTTRYLVGRVDVTPSAEDGSRIIRLMSGNGATVVEANLSPSLCEFIGTKLTEVEVIAEDADIEEGAPDGAERETD